MQGSYKCGACKPGFVGDQVTGCKSQTVRRCPNGEISPCHEKAQCIVERDGSLSCVVRSSPPCGWGLLTPVSLALCVLSWVCHSPLLESVPSRHRPALHYHLSYGNISVGALRRSGLLLAPPIHRCLLGFFCLKHYKFVSRGTLHTAGQGEALFSNLLEPRSFAAAWVFIISGTSRKLVSQLFKILFAA